MTAKRLSRYAYPVLIVAAGSTSLAHHSEVGFDTESAVLLSGVVTEFSWRNPHVYLNIDVTEPGGSVAKWQLQAQATMGLARAGWNPTILRPGDQIVARGHPARRTASGEDRKYAILLSIEKADGTVLEPERAGPPATAIATDLNGRWRATDESVDIFVEAYQQLSLTEKGASAKAEYDIYADIGLQSCKSMPTPVSPALAAQSYVAEIEVGTDTVILRSEYYDAERVVYMDGRAHPGDGERSLHGHSIGRWEDDVLVVDTTNFADHRAPLQDGVPSGPQRHVVERYDLGDDGRRLFIDLVVEDPEYLAEPLQGTIEWYYTPNARMFRYDCDLSVSRQYVSQ